MKWMTKTNEATPYANGTTIKSKSSGEIGTIEKQCFCGAGDWLHYEVRMDSIRVFQHADIERLFEVSR
jgi:hypothetical protein